MKYLYPYSQKNLLTTPEYYMFSEFKGQDGIIAYVDLRKRCCKQLEKRYSNALENGEMPHCLVPLLSFMNEVFSPSIQALHSSLSVTPKSNPSSTEARLCALLAKSFSDSWSQEELDFFIGRYEVTKKLYEAYAPDGKPLSNQFENLVNYALLQLCCAFHYKESRSLKSLSALLKLGDFACSSAFTSAGSDALCAAFVALNMEIVMILQLAQEKGVEWV